MAEEATIWVCEKGHVDDHHLTAPNPCDLCSRCGGTCTPFRSVDLLVREYVERLRVNVGLLAENEQLKKKLRERKSSAEPIPVVTRRGAGESGSPPADLEQLRNTAAGARSVADGHADVLADAANIDRAADEIEVLRSGPHYTPLPELADLLTSDEVVEAVAGARYERERVPKGFAWTWYEHPGEGVKQNRRSVALLDLQAAISKVASIKGEGHG